MTSPKAAFTNQYGERVYRGVDHDGQPFEYPGWNTTAAVLDKPGLDWWKFKKIAVEVANDEDLQATARVNENAAVRAALDKGNGFGPASIGDLVHYWTEQVDLDPGQIVNVPDEVRGYVEAWQAAKERHGIEIVAVERTVFNKTHGYAGSFDRALTMRAYRGVLIGDVKTTQEADPVKAHKIWPDHVLQISAYAHGEGIYDADLGTALPMPAGLRTDVGVVLKLFEDSYDIVPVDLAAAWPAVQGVAAAWHWTHRLADAAIGRPLPVTTLDPEDLA